MHLGVDGRECVITATSRTVCYHPLFHVQRPGRLPGRLAADQARSHSADDWDGLLVPEIDRPTTGGGHLRMLAGARGATVGVPPGQDDLRGA